MKRLFARVYELLSVFL